MLWLICWQQWWHQEALAEREQRAEQAAIAERKRNEKIAELILNLPTHQTTATERIKAQIILDEKRQREQQAAKQAAEERLRKKRARRLLIIFAGVVAIIALAANWNATRVRTTTTYLEGPSPTPTVQAQPGYAPRAELVRSP